MFLAVWSSYAAAQGLTEEIFLTELPQVLTASRIATSPLDAPAPVTVIDRETIRASGFTEIHDVLRLVPGYLVADWPLGSPVVVNHGLGDAYPNRLLVMVDGRSVVNPAYGAVDWQDLPLRLDDVERIEVVRGPNQASYGAGAFQGVIHIITREPSEDKCAGLTLARGRQGYADNYACIGRSNARLDWRLSLSSREATNFRDLGEYSHSFQEDIERQTFFGHMTFRPVLDEEWLLGISLSRGEDWVGSSLDPAMYPYRARKQRQLSARLAWHKHYAPGSQLSLEYARFQHSKREGYTLSGAGTSTPVQDDLDALRDALELQQIHAWSGTLQTVWGLGVRQDRAESARLFHGLGTVEATPWQVFANVDWRFDPSWLLHAGLTLERHPSTDALLSPRLALNWSLTPERSVRLSMGQGYRTPTLFETDARVVLRYFGSLPLLYGKIVDIGTWAVQRLEPEKTRFAEIGYVARYPQHGVVIDTRLFVERHERYIDDRACTVGVDCPFPPLADYLRPPCPGAGQGGLFLQHRQHTHGGRRSDPRLASPQPRPRVGLPRHHPHLRRFRDRPRYRTDRAAPCEQPALDAALASGPAGQPGLLPGGGHDVAQRRRRAAVLRARGREARQAPGRQGQRGRAGPDTAERHWHPFGISPGTHRPASGFSHP